MLGIQEMTVFSFFIIYLIKVSWFFMRTYKFIPFFAKSKRRQSPPFACYWLRLWNIRDSASVWSQLGHTLAESQIFTSTDSHETWKRPLREDCTWLDLVQPQEVLLPCCHSHAVHGGVMLPLRRHAVCRMTLFIHNATNELTRQPWWWVWYHDQESETFTPPPVPPRPRKLLSRTSVPD